MLARLIPISLALALLQVALRFRDDADLARRLRERDAGAMRELYDHYGRLIYSLIQRMVRNSAADWLCSRLPCSNPRARITESFASTKYWEREINFLCAT